MKEITKNQVGELAKLARLGLTEKEKVSLSDEMTEILGYVQVLEEVDTKNVQSTSQIMDLKNVMRKDEVIVSEISLEKRLINVPVKEKTFIKVKRVLE